MHRAALAFFALAAALAACERAAPAPTASTTAATTATVRKVAKVAFLDQENACDCTRKRIDDTWAALRRALGTPAKLPVERIHVDTQVPLADAYTTAKPLMVAPGLYFVDAQDRVIELLQGEVTTEQIAAVLARK